MIHEFNSDIQGVTITPLRIIDDERGSVLHMLRKDSDVFCGFGEVYFSEVKPGVIKGWKKHKRMTQNFTVPIGKIKLVIVDDRIESATHNQYTEVTIGRPDNYCLVTIPPMLCYAFKNTGVFNALLCNCSNMTHSSNESSSISLSKGELSYDW